MVSFKYGLNQDLVELQASNWNGLERVFVNGEMVSKKLNFRRRSEHKIQLNNGLPCSFKLLICPQTDQLVCRIYKQNQLVASLKQGKRNLMQSQKYFYNSLLVSAGMATALLYWLA